jgi:hypothetical protein
VRWRIAKDSRTLSRLLVVARKPVEPWYNPYVKRLGRFAFNALTALSLLLSIAAAVLWIAGGWPAKRVALGPTGTVLGRYSFVAERRSLGLWGPPARGAGPAISLGRVANGDVVWCMMGHQGTLAHFSSEMICCFPEIDDPDLSRDGRVCVALVDAARPMLEALDDPRRFAAAHVMLEHVAPSPRRLVRPTDVFALPESAVPKWNGHVWVLDYCGLCVELDPAPKPPVDAGHHGVFGRYQGEPTVRIDPAQLTALRAYWHSRLDRRIGSVAYWAVIAPGLVLPALFMRSRWVRNHRLRLGLCLSCGYDLRATRDRCPECGAMSAGADLRAGARQSRG